jgi:hypothetical protein
MSLARVALVLVSALPGFAVPITGGSMSSEIFELITIEFFPTGENFSIRGSGSEFSNSGACMTQLCQPGETVELDHEIWVDAGGEGTINGVNYDGLYFWIDDWRMHVPPLQLLEGVPSYTLPFTMNGFLRILDCPPLACEPDCLFNCDGASPISGRGAMTANFFKASFGDSEGFYVGLITYEFETPIPEPSTLFLISACVPLLWLRRAYAPL